MKQQIKYTLIPALIMLAGCHENNEFNGNISELVHTNVRQVEYSSIVKNEGRSITTPVYNNATQMVHNDSIFLFLNPNGEYRFTAYNINSKQTKRFVPAGYSEEEGLYYLDLNIHNTTATALDFGCGRLVEIDLTQCFNDEYNPRSILSVRFSYRKRELLGKLSVMHRIGFERYSKVYSICQQLHDSKSRR